MHRDVIESKIHYGVYVMEKLALGMFMGFSANVCNIEYALLIIQLSYIVYIWIKRPYINLVNTLRATLNESVVMINFVIVIVINNSINMLNSIILFYIGLLIASGILSIVCLGLKMKEYYNNKKHLLKVQPTKLKVSPKMLSDRTEQTINK
jgi:hypothetical protein